MLLADIRCYLQQRKIASLHEVALHFDIANDAAHFALNYWVKQGKVNVMNASCGTSCTRCSTEADRYQWQESQVIVIHSQRI